MIRKIQIGVVVYLLLVGSFLSPVAGKSTQKACHNGTEQNKSTMESSWGTCITSTFDKETEKLDLSAHSKDMRPVKNDSIVVSVDNMTIDRFSFNLSASENWNKTLDLSKKIDVMKDQHKVTIFTYGNRTQFNFIRNIDTSETNIPAPRIKNVSISNGKIEGEPSSVAYVTVTNPSEQLYSSKLIVHTQKTDGSLYLASVPPGESETFKVELLDSRGAKIVGEARLYTENLTDDDGALDQVGFVGQADGTTSAWNESFEPVRPPWMQDHYRYENDSHSKSFSEKVSGGQKVAGVPVVYPIVAALFGIFFVRRLR